MTTLFEDVLSDAAAAFTYKARALPEDPTGLGIDLSCTADIQASFAVVSGATMMAQAVVRRLTTPRGSVVGAPDYGLDAREYLSRGLTADMLAGIPGEIRTELLKDERITDATVTVQSSSDVALELFFRVEIGAGPFTFTLSVSEAAVLLSGVV